MFTTDHRYYASPWYDGAWQEMTPFGCTRAPYYPRDASCPRARPGKHHGIDMFMPCGTRIRSAVKGRVVQPDLGPAYGRYGLKIPRDGSTTSSGTPGDYSSGPESGSGRDRSSPGPGS